MARQVALGELHASTAHQRGRFYAWLRKTHGERHMMIPRHHIVRLRDERSPGTRDNFVKALSAMYSWAIERDMSAAFDALEAERDRLREAVDAIAPWLSASLSPKEEGGLGADAGSEYRAACDKVFRAALKETDT